MKNAITFRRRMEIIGINPYVLVTADEVRSLKANWRRPIPVHIQVNGQPKGFWRINMMPAGNGDFYLYLHADVRKASKTKVGDEVEVRVAFDETYKGGPTDLPGWLLAVIESDEKVHENWNALPPSRQKEIVRYMMNLKSDEARQRNLDKVKETLGGTSARFMGRDWKDGK